MKKRSAAPAVRAERLLRWYPAEWRGRYGAEFRELLVSEIDEQPRCLNRSVDVAIGGLMARLADAGLIGPRGGGSRQAQRGLVTFGCAMAVFMTVAASMWSQLNVAQGESQPTTSATHTAIVIMSVALFGSLALAVIAALPIAGHVAVAIGRRRTPGLWRPALLFGAGAATMIVGSHFVSQGWATGSHPWDHQAVRPDAIVAFLWASTLTVSAYWAHPTVLFGFPVTQIIWMVVSPLAILASVVGAARTVRRLDLTPGILRFASNVARVIALGLGVFLLGTVVWLIDGGPGPNGLFQAGTVDLVGFVLMAGTLGLAGQSICRSTPSR